MSGGSSCGGGQFRVVVDVVGDAVADGFVEIAVGVLLQQPPDAPAWRKRS